VFTLLARIKFTLPGVDFLALFKQVRAAIDTHFITEYEGQRIYAYATDGVGNYEFYHDANDIPLVMAPSWGMVSANDPVWSATIDFAFSAANTGGFYDGCLGSVHTRAPWPLGDMQEIIVARARGDGARMQTARKRIDAAAQWDGALPEAYDSEDYAVASRHWFCWPNAMLANLDLPDTMNITQPIRIQRKQNNDADENDK